MVPVLATQKSPNPRGVASLIAHHSSADRLHHQNVDRAHKEHENVQTIIIPLRDHARKVASIEKMKHVVAGNRADAHQGQAYPLNRCSGNRKRQVLEIKPELSAEGGDDIADIGEEVIEAIGQFTGKGERHQDRNHGREFSEQGVFGCLEEMRAHPDDQYSENKPQSQQNGENEGVRAKQPLLNHTIRGGMLDEPRQLRTDQKGDDQGTGEMTALVDDQFGKGIAQVQARAVFVAKVQAAAAHEAVDIVPDVEGAEVDWTSRRSLRPFLAEKGSTGFALPQVGSQLDHG